MDAPKRSLIGGSIPIFAGILIAVSLMTLVYLPNLLGEYTPYFLTAFFSAAGGYVIALWRLKSDRINLKMIWGFAILFRVLLLFTEPTLSDDVYRYIWDGHLLNRGLNPYTLPVNSQLLGSVDTPLRSLVNHNWMASPYFPTAQGVFALVTLLVPQSVRAFQVAAVVFDLLTGWVIVVLLKEVELPRQNALIYLWNPLVIVELAQGAHVVDAVMSTLMLLAIWFWLKEKNNSSVIMLAAATLTKFLPILLVPIFFWRWNWLQRVLFGLLLIILIGIFVPGAGLGLTGPLDGTGIFGALRIYLQKWNYNGGLYHWLEVWISGYKTPGAVPIEIVGNRPILITKAITTGLLGMVVLVVTWIARNAVPGRNRIPNLVILRLCLVPLAAFLLLTATIHPWYVTLIIPFFPFLLLKEPEHITFKLFMWAGIYFSIAVAWSYLTYLDLENLRELSWVRFVEYVPTYALLGWGIWKAFDGKILTAYRANFR
jgi:alpha-1,6-mannosyltransferase